MGESRAMNFFNQKLSGLGYSHLNQMTHWSHSLVFQE